MTLPLATVLVSGSPTELRMPGAAAPARLSASPSTCAARGGAAEQRIERLAGWRRCPAGAARRGWAGQREIGRDDQRRLARDRELVGPVAVEQAGRAAAGEAARRERGGRTNCASSGFRGRRLAGVAGLSRKSSERASSRTTPMVIAASATLNTMNGRNSPKCRSR